MSAVQIERGPHGYAVTRHFRNLPAALVAADQMLSVCEAAYEPVAVDPAALKLAEALARAESDDLPAHDGRRLNPPSQDAE